MPIDSDEAVTEEVLALLDYLEQRGLTELESLAVMGLAIEALIVDPDGARSFLETLENRLFKLFSDRSN